MTELFDGPAEVRCAPDGSPAQLRMPQGWEDVVETALTWRVETDWWRAPVRRDYMRCLLAGGECVEVYRDLADGGWHWVRRYD